MNRAMSPTEKSLNRMPTAATSILRILPILLKDTSTHMTSMNVGDNTEQSTPIQLHLVVSEPALEREED